MPSCDGAMVSGPRRRKRIVEPHQAAPEQRMIGLVQGAHAVDLVDRALLQMVLQVAARRPGASSTGVDPERRQPFRRPDAGAMQHLDRSDRAGAQDHLALGARLDDLAALHEAHAGGAAVLDDQPVDQHVRFEPQVGPLQRRLQKAARRRPAPPALLVDVEIADALIVAGVEIRGPAGCPSPPRRRRPRPESPRTAAAPRSASRRRCRDARCRPGNDPPAAGTRAARRPSPSRSGRAGASGRSRRPGRASRSWR